MLPLLSEVAVKVAPSGQVPATENEPLRSGATAVRNIAQSTVSVVLAPESGGAPLPDTYESVGEAPVGHWLMAVMPLPVVLVVLTEVRLRIWPATVPTPVVEAGFRITSVLSLLVT